MPNYCQRTRSYANLYRLQFCQARDEQTVYDPVEACSRCKRCGERAIQCSACLTLVHWGESPCPHCGTNLSHRWGGASGKSAPSGGAHSAKGNGARSALVPHKSVEDAIIEFFRLLPFEAAKAAYLLAIQELHPNRAGAPEKASRL